MKKDKTMKKAILLTLLLTVNILNAQLPCDKAASVGALKACKVDVQRLTKTDTLTADIINTDTIHKLDILTDINSVRSIRVNTRQLMNNAGDRTMVDWQNGYLQYPATNTLSVDWILGDLWGGSLTRSMNWINRTLHNSSGNICLNYSSAANGIGILNVGSNNSGFLKNSFLTANRTFQFPDSSGRLALTTSNVYSASRLNESVKINGEPFNATSNIKIPTIPANSIVLIGDSYTALHRGGVSPGITTPGNGYFNIANTRMRKKFHILNYAGVAGERTDQIKSRFVTNVLDLKPGWVAIQGGINDVFQSINAATIFNNLKSMYDTASLHGIRVVVFTIPIIPAFGTASLRNTAHQVNSALKQDIRSKQNILLVDVNTVLVDQSTGLVSSSYIQADNTHLNNLGSSLLGDYVYQILDEAIYNQIDMLPSTSNDNLSNFPGGVDFTNLLPNGMLTGNVSGLATNWATNVTLSTGGSGVLNTDFQQSKVSSFSNSQRRYTNFDWQQLKAIGSTSVEKRFAFRVSSVSSITGFSVGDYYYAECEFETDDDWVNVTRLSLELMSTTASFTPSTTSIDLFNDVTYGNHPGATVPQYNIRSGVLRTYPIQIVTGRDRLYSEFKFYAGNGTVRIGRMAIKKAIPYTVGGVTYFLY